MLLHVLHNGLLITISQFEDRLQEMGIGTAERQHLPVTWIVAAAVPVVIASVILWRHRRAATATQSRL